MIDESSAREIAETHLREQISEGGQLRLRKFSRGWVASCRFEAPRPPGDVLLAIFEDEGSTELFPSWPVDELVKYLEGGADGWGLT